MPNCAQGMRHCADNLGVCRKVGDTLQPKLATGVLQPQGGCLVCSVSSTRQASVRIGCEQLYPLQDFADFLEVGAKVVDPLLAELVMGI